MPQPLFKLELPVLKTLAGLLGILFGGLGLHKFLLGYTVPGIVEGVIYLLKTPEQFRDTYVSGNRPWF